MPNSAESISGGSVNDAADAIEALSIYRRDSAIADRVRKAVVERSTPEIRRIFDKFCSN